MSLGFCVDTEYYPDLGSRVQPVHLRPTYDTIVMNGLPGPVEWSNLDHELSKCTRLSISTIPRQPENDVCLITRDLAEGKWCAVNRIEWFSERGKTVYRRRVYRTTVTGYRSIEKFSDDPDSLVDQDLYGSFIDCPVASAIYDRRNGIHCIEKLHADIPDVAQYGWPLHGRRFTDEETNEDVFYEWYDTSYVIRITIDGLVVKWTLQLGPRHKLKNTTWKCEDSRIFTTEGTWTMLQAFEPKGLEPPAAPEQQQQTPRRAAQWRARASKDPEPSRASASQRQPLRVRAPPTVQVAPGERENEDRPRRLLRKAPPATKATDEGDEGDDRPRQRRRLCQRTTPTIVSSFDEEEDEDPFEPRPFAF